ncbi:beta-galactosidase [Lentzea sp. NPDC051213]|uniref:beta-galactosidase n=1 Tax=Lentzea sp. NPDC051213 TaxID=3364126 RepID=UPI0037ADC274
MNPSCPSRFRLLTLLLAAVLAFASVVPPPNASAVPPPSPHSVTYDGYSFMIDGKRTYLWSGEFHYYRLPSVDLWRDVLQKMKAGGFNAVSLYFDWGYHSPREGVYDFTGVRDVNKLLDIAAEVGVYVIARPGPYIAAEIDGGGFPTWLTTKPGAVRSADPAYLKYADEWLTRIDRILAGRQWVDGRGPVIAYQVENEFYEATPQGHAYIRHLADKARADGIRVPLLGNHQGLFNTGEGALDVDGFDHYPLWFNCANPQEWDQVPDVEAEHPAGKPLYLAEYQGGAFDAWGGPGYDKCAHRMNDQFANVFYKHNIAGGATAQNFYMLYGGTSWGWSSIPQNYTSYDYGAAISETRQLAPKYYENKLIGYFTQAVAPLTKTDRLAAAAPSAPDVIDTARVNPDTGTQFHVLRHRDATSTATSDTRLDLDLGAAGRYSLPQQPGTSIRLNGRQSKILLAGYDLGATSMRYSTSELMTNATIGGRDVAVLYGDANQAGETVLRYAAQPKVTVLSGSVESTWDGSRGDLRLNYLHNGLARVLVTGGERPLLLLLGDKETAKTFWRQDTPGGPVLVRGTHLLRTAADGPRLALTGDVGTDGAIEVFSGARAFSWNGRPIAAMPTPSGSVAGVLPTAKPVSLPELTGWRQHQEAPEAQPGFDDSTWPVATKMSTESSTPPVTLPVLFSDDYGFHTGNTWYRGHFTASGKETGIGLTSLSGGRAGQISVWLNGMFLGSADDGRHDFTFPAGSIKSGDNVLSVLTVNMGHEATSPRANRNKLGRGLIGARLTGAPTSVTWRLQGVRGGENGIDPVRGPLSTGGLYGERAGWSLPRFPDQDWKPVTLPASVPEAGVTWYRTTSTLDLPKGQDTSLGIEFTDNPDRRYRALLFVNGWQIGHYINHVGPQHSFPVPNGVLNPNGTNTIALAVWNLDATTGGLGQVKLVNYGSHASALTVRQNASPAYDPRRHEMPESPLRMSLSMPDNVADGQRFTASATVTALESVVNLSPELSVPEGWQVGVPTPATVGRLDAGQSVTFTWPVTVSKAAKVSPVTAKVSYRHAGRTRSTEDTRVVATLPSRPPAGENPISALEFLAASNGWGPVERDRSNGEAELGDGRPISLRGNVFPRGLGAHALSEIELYLAGACDRFVATVGVDDETKGGGSVAFRVLLDGRTVATTPVLTGTSAPVPLDVPVSGGQVLSLVVDDAGNGNASDHADWAMASLTCR